MDCEEFKKIRHLHIIVKGGYDKIDLEKSDDNIKHANRKYLADVFNAFPDVSFTCDYRGKEISIEKAINYQKKYQTVIFIISMVRYRVKKERILKVRWKNPKKI